MLPRRTLENDMSTNFNELSDEKAKIPEQMVAMLEAVLKSEQSLNETLRLTSGYQRLRSNFIDLARSYASRQKGVRETLGKHEYEGLETF